MGAVESSDAQAPHEHKPETLEEVIEEDIRKGAPNLSHRAVRQSSMSELNQRFNRVQNRCFDSPSIHAGSREDQAADASGAQLAQSAVCQDSHAVSDLAEFSLFIIATDALGRRTANA